MTFDPELALSVAAGVFVGMTFRDKFRAWNCRRHFLNGAKYAENKWEPRAPTPDTLDANEAWWAGYKDQKEGQERWERDNLP